MDKNRKQVHDDLFDAFSMLAGGNLVSLYDVQSQITRWSPSCVELFGLSGEYVSYGAYNWSEYVHPEDRKNYERMMNALIRCETLSYDITYRVRTKNGSYSIFRHVGAVIRDDEGRASLIGGMMINEGLLENTDPITVTRNKYGFFSDIAMLRRDKKSAVFLMLGIGTLAKINEEYGYSYGNRVLQQVSWILQEMSDNRGTIYRLEGSRFAFITETMSEAEVANMYSKLRTKLKRGISVGELRHSLRVSGSMLSANGLHMNERSIYSCLGIAYAESKEKRFGALVSFNGGSELGSEKTLEMIGVIRHSILEDFRGFYLVYQPIFDTKTGNISGAEVLIRWSSKEYGDVRSGDFIPILENDAIFEELGYWILQAAMRDGLELMKLIPGFDLSLNIFPAQIEKDYFTETLVSIAKETGFPPSHLRLELTSGCRALGTEYLKLTADSLREHDIQLVIDDFGRGYASLDFLKELSADEVKPDAELVRGIAESETDALVLKHLTEMAALYGAKVCVKGIETEAMRDAALGLPADELQGHLYSKPLILEEFINMIKNGGFAK